MKRAKALIEEGKTLFVMIDVQPKGKQKTGGQQRLWVDKWDMFKTIVESFKGATIMYIPVEKAGLYFMKED